MSGPRHGLTHLTMNDRGIPRQTPACLCGWYSPDFEHADFERHLATASGSARSDEDPEPPQPYSYTCDLDDGDGQVLITEWIDSNGDRVSFTAAFRPDDHSTWRAPVELTAVDS